MISIANITATRTRVDAHVQRHLLPVVANVTVLGGVGRVDFDKLTTGAFSLVRKEAKELRPGSIHNRLSQAVVMHHATGRKVLDTN